MLATFAALLDRRLPDDAGLDSFNFLPVLLGQQSDREPVRPNLVVNQSLRSGAWKWIEGSERLLWFKPESGFYPAKDEPPGQLSNLADDPHETKNLAAAHPEIVAEMKTALAATKRGTRTRP